MPANIIESNSTQTIFSINHLKWKKEKGADTGETELVGGAPAFEAHPEQCPWVKIGDLYVSVTTTGDKSWGQVVKDRFAAAKETKFTILSGRHGNQNGAKVDERSGQFLTDVGNATHAPELLKEDQDEIARLKKEKSLAGIDIEAFDVGKAPYNSAALLRKFADAKLKEHRVVIFSWCYSLCAMREMPVKGEEQPPLIVRMSHANWASSQPISKIVKDDYAWIK